MKNKIILPLFLFLVLFALPKYANAATLFLSPSSGSYTVGQTITVSVRTNTQGSAVNTAEARITYSTDTLDLIKVTQGSTFFLSAPGSPSKGNGTAYIGGGLPTPGYDGSSGLLGTLTFQARAQGTATISISDGKVLLNDGFGTNALSSSGSARFTIGPPAVGGVQVSSSTHPDPSKWYNQNRVDLTWSRPNGAYGFSFDFNQEEGTTPDNELDTTITTNKTYSDLKDGVWYFHIKARRQDQGSFGAVTHFKISIDTKSPLPFEVKLVGEDTSTETTQTPTLSFETKDDLSGVDHYSVFLNDDLYKENISSPFTFDQISGGEKNIKVVAYDKAGNQTASAITIRVKSGPGVLGFLSRSLSIPMYLIIFFGLLFLLLLILIVWALQRKGSRRSDPDFDVKQVQQEIDESLEDLKQEISQKLLGLSAKSSEELFEKETVVAKDLRNGIVKTRNKIDKKISRLKKKTSKSE